MTKGILIFATGHPYYGRMAFNLAFSIKAVAPGTEIAVVHSGNALNHLAEDNREVFDHIIPFEEDMKPGPLVKLYAGYYSPFAETMIIDADTLWLPYKTPEELFNEVSGSKFMAITEGKESDRHSTYPVWAAAEDIRQYYELKTELFQWRSEVMYFDVDGGAILDRALEIYRENKIKNVLKFAGDWPDELPIGIAAAEAGLVPKIYKWNPTYWHNIRGGHVPRLADIAHNHYLLSFGSGQTNSGIKQMHNDIMSIASGKLKRPFVFPLINKQSWNPARVKM